MLIVAILLRTNDNEDDLVPAIENDDHLDSAKTKNLTAHVPKNPNQLIPALVVSFFNLWPEPQTKYR